MTDRPARWELRLIQGNRDYGIMGFHSWPAADAFRERWVAYEGYGENTPSEEFQRLNPRSAILAHAYRPKESL